MCGPVRLRELPHRAVAPHQRELHLQHPLFHREVEEQLARLEPQLAGEPILDPFYEVGIGARP